MADISRMEICLRHLASLIPQCKVEGLQLSRHGIRLKKGVTRESIINYADFGRKAARGGGRNEWVRTAEERFNFIRHCCRNQCLAFNQGRINREEGFACLIEDTLRQGEEDGGEAPSEQEEPSRTENNPETENFRFFVDDEGNLIDRDVDE